MRFHLRTQICKWIHWNSFVSTESLHCMTFHRYKMWLCVVPNAIDGSSQIVHVLFIWLFIFTYIMFMMIVYVCFVLTISLCLFPLLSLTLPGCLDRMPMPNKSNYCHFRIEWSRLVLVRACCVCVQTKCKCTTCCCDFACAQPTREKPAWRQRSIHIMLC